MKKIICFSVVCLWFSFTLCGMEQPFRWQAEISGNILTVTAKIQPSYYFYRSTLVFDIQCADKQQALPVKFPSGTVVADDIFGKVEVYPTGTWQWIYKSDSPIVKAAVNFQGCRRADAENPAMCFMPETVNLLPGADLLVQTEDDLLLRELPLKAFSGFRTLNGLHSAPEFSAWLDGALREENRGSAPPHGFWLLVLLALLGGLGLNLTPCVLPMIPITLAIIGAGKNVSPVQGFRRGLLYGAGMTIAYGALGLAVILAGARFGELQSSMYFNFAVAGIFLFLAVAMSGVIQLDFSRFSAKFRFLQLPGGSGISPFFLGMVSALLAGACVAPVVITVLLFASSRYQSDGISALLLPFCLGAGMALPWPFAGAGLAVLPRPGRFMVWVKYLFAILIGATALWYAWTGWQLRPGVWDAQKEFKMLSSALTAAEEEKKDALIDFTASWCKNCAAMEKVLKDPVVSGKLKRFKVIRFRAESLNDPRIAALLKKWQISGLPAFVLLERASR